MQNWCTHSHWLTRSDKTCCGLSFDLRQYLRSLHPASFLIPGIADSLDCRNISSILMVNNYTTAIACATKLFIYCWKINLVTLLRYSGSNTQFLTGHLSYQRIAGVLLRYRNAFYKECSIDKYISLALWLNLRPSVLKINSIADVL